MKLKFPMRQNPERLRTKYRAGRLVTWLSTGVLMLCVEPFLLVGAFGAGKVDFSKDIQPILARRCFACHGPDKHESNLRFDNRDSVIASAESGARAIVPKESSTSELIRRVSSEDDSIRMPPEGKALTEAEVSLLRRWIDEGAEFSAHWSFQPIRKPLPPVIDEDAWTRHPIDAFVLKQLRDQGLSPAEPARAEVLIRRAYLDVIGLPPSPETARELAASWSDATYERLIDQLLADPALGERWARNWLDVVRFAETNSFERDGGKPNAWKYRDYVIASFTSDKGYDEFIREQLAGDELDQVTPETLTATGFYRLGIWDDEPADPLQARFDEYDDIVSTAGQSFLALTFNCARCHDHKIDPITQKDYYSLVSFFRDVTSYASRSDQRENNQLSVSPKHLTENFERLTDQTKSITRELRRREQNAIAKMPAPDQRATEGPQRKRVLKEKLRQFMEDDDWTKYTSLQAELETAQAELRQLPPIEFVLGLAKCDPIPPTTHVLLRGNPHNPGPDVGPAFPTILGGGSPRVQPPADNARSAGRRRALADWIASPDNWLASRVIVNRIWQYYFGRGLVRSANNFGLMGDSPTHPEILDYLAQELVAHDWSLKAVHRAILLSSTYRMSSSSSADYQAKDPDNRLLSHQTVRRLSAEQLRDSILAVTGELNEQQFGESIYPTLSAEVLASQSRPGSGWGQSSPAEQARRSVYIHVKRSLPVPMLAAFDFPETDISCEARFLTTQPAQALGMLNSAWMQQQSQALANRVRREVGDRLESQARRMLELVQVRLPHAQDIADLLSLTSRLKEQHKLDDVSTSTAMALVALNLNEFAYID